MKKKFDLINFIITVPVSLFIGFATFVGSAIITISTIFVSRKTAEKVVWWVLGWWHKVLLRTARVKLTVIGQENIPESGCLFLFNHLSLYDIPVMIAAIPKPAKFGAKAELYKIPLFGRAVEAYGSLKIERSNRQNAIETLNLARSRLANGECFCLAAEGTRQPLPQIGEFKSGPFIFAIQAQAPIVPVVIYGTDKILPKKQLFLNFNIQKNVTVQLLPPVPTTGYTVDTREDLKNKVRPLFIEAYEALKKRDISKL